MGIGHKKDLSVEIAQWQNTVFECKKAFNPWHFYVELGKTPDGTIPAPNLGWHRSFVLAQFGCKRAVKCVCTILEGVRPTGPKVRLAFKAWHRDSGSVVEAERDGGKTEKGGGRVENRWTHGQAGPGGGGRWSQDLARISMVQL